jgi:hypothetical protein
MIKEFITIVKENKREAIQLTIFALIILVGLWLLGFLAFGLL